MKRCQLRRRRIAGATQLRPHPRVMQMNFSRIRGIEVRRFARYASVSVISTVTTLSVLGVLVGVVEFPSTWANVVAVRVSGPCLRSSLTGDGSGATTDQGRFGVRLSPTASFRRPVSSFRPCRYTSPPKPQPARPVSFIQGRWSWRTLVPTVCSGWSSLCLCDRVLFNKRRSATSDGERHEVANAPDLSARFTPGAQFAPGSITDTGCNLT